MSATVTTLTISAVKNANLYPILALILVVTLLLLIIIKEIISTSTHRWALELSKVLNVGLISLFLAFAMVAFSSMVDVLR